MNTCLVNTSGDFVSSISFSEVADTQKLLCDLTEDLEKIKALPIMSDNSEVR